MLSQSDSSEFIFAFLLDFFLWLQLMPNSNPPIPSNAEIVCSGPMLEVKLAVEARTQDRPLNIKFFAALAALYKQTKDKKTDEMQNKNI